MAKALQEFDDAAVARLVKWYRVNQRDFPWRGDPNPYWVWIAEIMSQQTQMSALMPYFHRFIEKFPNVETLAHASESQVLSAWTGLGYYSRARNVHRAAQAVVARGGFPSTYEGWLELPGVGPYTAAAVVSQCFGVAEPVWDGNVQRVCSRLDARADAHAPAFRVEMLEVLRERIQKHSASDFNQALMELGAIVCTPKSPSCGRCPIQGACRAFSHGVVDQFPPPKPRREQVELRARVFVAVRESRKNDPQLFVRLRPHNHWFGGMWDFPSELGGKIKPIDTEAIDAVFRSVSSPGIVSFGVARHQITHHKIFLEGVRVRVEKNKFSNVSSGKWLSLSELLSDHPPVPLSTTARKILKLFCANI